MAITVEPERAAAPPATEAGAIQEARRRQARRRRGGAGALLAVGALAAWLVGGSPSKPLPSRGRGRGRSLAVARARHRPALAAWTISPALEGGSYGWCLLEDDGAGSCASTPVEDRSTPSGVLAIGTTAGANITAGEERITALIGPAVRGVLADGRPARLLVRGRLPYGLRIAQIEIARAAPVAKPGQSPAPPLRAGGPPALLATGAGGSVLGSFVPEAASTRAPVRWWARPQTPPPGPCQIRAAGLPALEGEWGHVAGAIRAYPARIIGRAFFSCVDSEYYLHGWPLETAVLLDAQHPGAPPAPIPGMAPVTGAPGIFNAPGAISGELTALRRGNAWLVVAGGSGLAQRIEVLRHLRMSVSL